MTTPDLGDFVSMGEAYLNHFFGVWIELAILLDVLAVGIGFQLAAARGVFSLARDGVLPKALASTNKRSQPIGGVVTGPKGPEAGVWVIAETTDLPTKFAKIVVTDDQGRYALPELPKAIWSGLALASAM